MHASIGYSTTPSRLARRCRAAAMSLAVALVPMGQASLAAAACPSQPPLDALLLGPDDVGTFGVRPIGVTAGATLPNPGSAGVQAHVLRRMWQHADPVAAVGQIIDIRYAFASDAQATEYLSSAAQSLSEGAPLDSELQEGGVAVRVYGPRNERVTAFARSQGLPETAFIAYAFVFAYENVVAKVFVMKGLQAPPTVNAETFRPFARAAIRKLRAECLGALKPKAVERSPVFTSQGGHTLGVRAVDVSPDGATLATASNDESVKLWSMAAGQEIRTLVGCRGPVFAVRFSRSGRLVAAGGWDGSVRVWDAATGELVTSVPLPSGSVDRLAWAPGDMQLAVGLGPKVGEPSSLALVTLGAHPTVVTSKALGTVDSLIYTADGGIVEAIIGEKPYRFDARTAALQLPSPASNPPPFPQAPDRRFRFKYGADARILEVADARDGAVIGTIAVHRYRAQTGNLVKYFRLAASPSNRSFAMGGVNNEIDAWIESPAAGRFRHHRLRVGARVAELRFDATGERILFVVGDELRLWLPGDESGLVVAKLGQPIIAMAVQQEAPRSVALLTRDKLVVLGGSPLKLLKEVSNAHAETDERSAGLTWRADGTLAKASGAQVVLWRASGEAQPVPLKNGGISVVAADADGSVFVAGGRPKWLLDPSGRDSGQIVETSLATGVTTSRGAQAVLSRVVASASELTVASSVRLESQARSLAVGGEDVRVAVGTDRGAIGLFLPSSLAPAGATVAGAGDITDLAFLSKGNILMSTGLDQAIRFWNTQDVREPIATLVSRNGEWTVVTPSGLFDTNTIEDTSRGAWVMPDRPMQTLSTEIFMRDYFEPGLLGKVLVAEPLRRVSSIGTLNRAQPVVRIDEIRLGSASDPSAEVTVAVTGPARQSETGIAASEAYDLRLFRDGQLVAQWPESVQATSGPPMDLVTWRRTSRISPGASVTGATRHTFRVALPSRQDGKAVVFSAYAFNEDRVKSATARTAAPGLPVGSTARTPRAYVIAVGANAYDDRRLNLEFAARDAQVMSEALARLNGYDVVRLTLTSEEARPERAARMQVTKANIRAVLQLLAGRDSERQRLMNLSGIDTQAVARLRKANPDDLVLLAFSTHGYTEPDGKFYLLPSDGARADGRPTPAVLSSYISSDELSDWLRDVDAGQIALIIDACHSAASVAAPGFRPGPMGDRGLGQLAYDKGVMILAATQAADVARELGSLQLGLLTFALTRDAFQVEPSEPGRLRADRDGNGVISLREWLQYGEQRVPALYAEIRSGGTWAGGEKEGLRDSTVVAGTVDLEALIRSAQQPALFDFKDERLRVEFAPEQQSIRR